MAAHPSCTWNRCRIDDRLPGKRKEGKRRRRGRRMVAAIPDSRIERGIYRGFEVCPRGAQTSTWSN